MVFEGEVTETTIFNNLIQFFLNDIKNTIVYGIFGSDIYNLYHTLKVDEDLDLFSLIKEQTPELSGISRDKVPQIFLFFDFDGHAPSANDEKIEEMLSFFDNETEYGKLYLSYPMVEAIKHLKAGTHFKDVIVPARDKVGYKELVSCSGDGCYQNLANLNKVHWDEIINEHCRKLGFIMNGTFEFPETDVEQNKIFAEQKAKYLDKDGTVAVLSSFPIYLADYYGYEHFKHKLANY